MASAMFNSNKKHSDIERWVCIYPAYINSKKTLAEGRRIPKAKCVENPTHQEIRDVLTAAGMKIHIENKQYCRERSKELLYRGRIRVQIKDDDGVPLKPELATREAVMVHLAEMIPKLKSRSGKQGPGEQGQSQAGAKKKGKGKR